MKVVQINAVYGKGSTGKICSAISNLLSKQEIENYIIYSSGESDKNSNGIKIFGKTYYKIQALKSRVFGNYGFNSYLATKKIIKRLRDINPDVVLLHNLHGHNVKIDTLFSYFRKNPEIKIFWTFHDCWNFTGYCPHYYMAKCDKWQTECNNCKLKNRYSWLFDKSRKIFLRKKKAILNQNLTIISPSEWLKGEIKKSFCKDYPVYVINNGIDLEIFKPTESNFRERYKIGQDRKIVLGVGSIWNEKKGLDVFYELSKRLDESYQIVLVGYIANGSEIPSNIIHIKSTESQTELAKIYSASNVFVNPTREEVLGLVNIEANACGVPVITFNTGGSPECIDGNSGIVVEKEDIDGLIEAINDVCLNNKIKKENCISNSKRFNENSTFKEYVDLIYNFKKE